MKTRALIIILFTFYLTSGLYSQQLSLRWAQQFGNTGWDYVRSLQQTNTGKYILGGSYKGNLPGDTLHPFWIYNSNAWLAACDSNGSVLWQKIFGGKEFENIISIEPTSEGIVISGLFQDTLHLDSLSVASEAFTSGYISMINEQGNSVWLKSIGGKAFISNLCLSKNLAGNNYLAGAFRDSLTINGNLLASAGDNGVFFSGIQADGTLTSVHIMKCSGSVAVGSMCNNDSLVCITGSYSDTLRIGDTMLVSAGGKDIYIAMYNQAGTVKWVRSYGGVGDDEPSDISLSEDGRLAITGSFEYSALFSNQILLSNGGKDLFVVEHSTDGVISWIRSVGGISDDYGYCTSYDENNVLFASGSFIHAIQIPDENGNMVIIEATSPFGNAFIAKFNHSGALKASFNLPGSSENYCTGLLVNDNIITAAGVFYETLHFQDSIGQQLTIESLGEKDIFLMQFRDMCDGFTVDAGADTLVCPGQTIYLSSPEIYSTWQWLPGGYINQELEVADTGSYTLIASNQNGCIASDSIYVNLAPIPQVFAGNDTLVKPGDILALNSALISEADTYHWETTGDGYFFNNELINTSYSLSYNDVSKGSVMLKLMAQNTCATVSDSLLLSLPVEEDGITVYPNPTSDHVILVCREGLSISNVTITRQTGELIQGPASVNSFMYQYNLYPYTPGSYVFHLTLNTGIVVTKVVNKL